MPKLIAVHEIVRGPQNKREVIDPKTEFDATEKEAEELLAAGAARIAPEAKPKKAAAKTDDVI